MPPRDAIAIPMEQQETRAPWMTAATKQKATVGVVTAVSTIGVSAVLVLWGFPWMMRMVTDQQKAAAEHLSSDRQFTQGKLTELLERSIVTGEKQAAATNSNTRCLETLQDSHQDLCVKLDRLIEIQTEAAK
jgi:hypothetical protein